MGEVAFAQTNETRLDGSELPRIRLQASGFGRHTIKAAGERESLYGADIDLYFNVWRNPQFNWWVGIGGGCLCYGWREDGGCSGSVETVQCLVAVIVPVDTQTFIGRRGCPQQVYLLFGGHTRKQVFDA